MKNFSIILFLMISFLKYDIYAQKVNDSLTKKEVFAKEINKKSSEQIKEAYKKTHPQKPDTIPIKKTKKKCFIFKKKK